MSGTRTNPDHLHPCNNTLTLCFSYPFHSQSLLSVSNLVSLTLSLSPVFSYKTKVKQIYILFTRSRPDHLLWHTAARFLFLLLEPLDLLFNLLWVDLRLTILRLLGLIPGCCEETALLENVSRPALRQLFDHDTDHVESMIQAICPVITSTVAVSFHPLQESPRVESRPGAGWTCHLHYLIVVNDDLRCLLLLPFLTASQ